MEILEMQRILGYSYVDLETRRQDEMEWKKRSTAGGVFIYLLMSMGKEVGLILAVRSSLGPVKDKGLFRQEIADTIEPRHGESCGAW